MTLPVVAAHRLSRQVEERRWLIDGLWSEGAVGILGGEPKCCKSFLALDMAVAVATGRPCLRRFGVPSRGRVLLYAAEDPPRVVRERLDGICGVAGVALEDADVQVIVTPTIRLDHESDRIELMQTIEIQKPRLLILDPFVRLHQIDENNSGDVAPLLGFLRGLQRHLDVAIVLVHHAKKGGSRSRPGQALRGSSEFHAWGDSNLYMRRAEDRLTLHVEHRAASSMPPVPLSLEQADEGLALEIVEAEPESPAGASTPAERVLEVLAEADGPMTQRDLRSDVGVRSSTLTAILSEMIEHGRVLRTASGYVVADRDR